KIGKSPWRKSWPLGAGPCRSRIAVPLPLGTKGRLPWKPKVSDILCAGRKWGTWSAWNPLPSIPMPWNKGNFTGVSKLWTALSKPKWSSGPALGRWKGRCPTGILGMPEQVTGQNTVRFHGMPLGVYMGLQVFQGRKLGHAVDKAVTLVQAIGNEHHGLFVL